jgi:hypothetical protein
VSGGGAGPHDLVVSPDLVLAADLSDLEAALVREHVPKNLAAAAGRLVSDQLLCPVQYMHRIPWLLPFCLWKMNVCRATAATTAPVMSSSPVLPCMPTGHPVHQGHTT